MERAAERAAVANRWQAAEGDLRVEAAAGAGLPSGQAVEVQVERRLERYFTSLFDAEPILARARSVAVYENVSQACVLALSRSASRAVNVSGSASVTLNGCDVASNSVAGNGISVWGSATLKADCAISAGGVAGKAGLELQGCRTPVTLAPPVQDPFADLALTRPAGASREAPRARSNETVGLEPGVYLSGLRLDGRYALAPGVYYVGGGGINLGANARVSGHGVTFLLTDGATVRMNGSAELDLTAPTTGPYAGMLFFGDRNASGGVNVLNGNSSSRLTGHIYFPAQAVEYRGNFSGANGCTHIVADTVEFIGSVSLSADCRAAGMDPVDARQVVRLVA
ncbi:hypothetical protein LRS10_20270 [Phenylobacterium sp. J426]|uniref:hypothetical protein n=1 Tax=Phenylobacterium sp. J426 TaxID=2898439 RepID=UPI002151AF01|nr:hypothetical protein [Phenylobacterium sp. J426]MCR5876278.1 hypothetical protein [Phenylobacterium sp. J426]